MKTVGLRFPTEVKEFACPYCDKIYKTEKGLKEHIAKEHADDLNPEE